MSTPEDMAMKAKEAAAELALKLARRLPELESACLMTAVMSGLVAGHSALMPRRRT